MNSRVSWSVDGIDPTVRERAEAAARRAGMSLNDWLTSTIGEASPPNFREPYAQPQPAFAQEARAVDDIHQRLDSITRQIEQISRPAPPAAPFIPPPMAAPAPPAGPDFSALERHLLKITSQIESLQRPDHIEQSIAAFRSELADIRHAITEAMPRRAIESIENEIRSLHRRIEDTRSHGTDGQALAGIERALGEIYDALRSLTPAEQLAGYDDAIRNLHTKLD